MEFLLPIRKSIYSRCFGYPFTSRSSSACNIPNRVSVAPTWLVNCEFSGLFASDADGGGARQGEILCVCCGDWLRTAQAVKRKDKSYLMRLGAQSYIDALPHSEVAARFINDCINPAGWNVEFVKLPELGCALVVAAREITAGEELFVSYGKWYWVGSEAPAPVRMTFLAIQRHCQRLTATAPTVKEEYEQQLTNCTLKLK